MKKIILVCSLLCLGLFAYAGMDVSIGVNAGVPYYAQAPSYYNPNDEAVWMNEPAQVIMIDGSPHQMHMWNGRWYDEAWRGGKRDNMRQQNWHDTEFNDRDWHRSH
jgi:hypothetical protein